MVFGKNSARPRDEVQEVVYFPAAHHEPGSKVEVSDVLQSLGEHAFSSACLARPSSHLPWELLAGPSCHTSSVDSPFH